MKNICFTYFPSVKKNALGINRALVAKKNALGINRALVAKKNLASLFVICLTLLSGFSSNVRADELTVANGNSTNEYLPVYGWYADTGFKNQFIYSSGLLSDMADGTISSMAFYSATSTLTVGTTAKIIVRIAEVANTTFASASYISPASFTEVYNGIFNTLTTSGSDKLLVIPFSVEYVYGGGNLLVEIQLSPKGTNAPNSSFYGISSTGNGLNGYNSTYSNIYIRNFLPKVTFTYESAAPVSCPKPSSLAGLPTSGSSATITWKKKGAETSWNLQYSSNNGVSWTTLNLTTSNVIVDGSGNCSYILSGLSAETTYKIRVQADCGGGDLSDYTAAASFETPCGSISSFPWTENFESVSANTLMRCWDNSSSTTTTKSGSYPYYVWGVYSYGGNKMLRMYNFYVQSGTALINTPVIDLPAAPRLTFKYAHNANCGTCYVKISTNGGSTFTNIGNFTKGSGSDKDNPGTFTNKTIDLSAYAGQSVIIQFFANANYGSGAIFIDDVHIESTQDCSKPSTPVASDVTGNSAHLSWAAKTGVTSYKYIYKTTSSAPTSSEWESASTTGNTYVDLSALTDGTTYYFWVMCACGTVASDACSFTPLSCPSVTGVTLTNKLYNGVTVNWTTSSSTNCDVRYKAGSGAWTSAGTNISGTSKAITGLSVGTTYTFEVKPSCSADGWVAADETYTPTCPAVGALTLSGQKYNGVTINWSAVVGISTYNLRYRKGSDSWTTVNDIAALTYTIASGLVTNQEYSIEVQTECGSTWSSTTYTPIAADPAVVSVNSITETTATPTWTDMSAEGATGYKYILVDRDAVVDWSAATSVNSVTFSASLSGLTLGTDYDVYVQTIYPGPIYSDGKKRQFTTDVNKPTGLTRGTLTSTSVQFSWTAGGGATQYQYLCLPSGTTPTESHWSSSTLTSLTSVTVEGLTPNTSYIFHVRAYYNGKVSARVYSVAFTTPCGTEDLPYSQNFGTSAGIKPACWTCDRWLSGGTGYWYTFLVDGTNYGVQYMTKNGYPSADLQTPSIYLSDKANLTFKYSNYYSSRAVPSSVIISNGVTTKTVNLPTTASGTLTSYTIDLSNVSGTNFTGTTVTITFRGSASSSASISYFRLDDVAITAKSCTTPTANAVSSITSNSAVITWTDTRAEEWSVRYRTYNAGEWTVVNNLTVKSYTMTGLATETEYEVQVRNDCSASSSSSWTSSKRFTTTPLCPIPSGLTNTNTTYNSVTVTWTAGGDETGWNIQTKPDGGSWSASTHVASASYIMSGLTSGTTYHYRVQADCGGAWVEGTYTPVCPTITDITLTNETVTGVHVNWTLSGGNVPCSVRYRSALELLIWHTAVSDTEETLCAISGLTPDVEYHIQVKTACGDWIDAENYTPRILPPTPTITAYDGSVKVTWSNVLLASGYQYVVVPRDAAHSWSSAVSVATNPTDANPLIISGLSTGTAYDLYVRTSYLLIHSLERKEPFATITMAPVGLTNTDITTTTASFTWNKDANSSATQFQWACKPGSTAPSAGDWSEPLGMDVRNYTVTELENGTNYTFYVRTYYGEGVYSSAVSQAFTTECGIKQLDYIENFEGGNPPCWTTTLDEWSTLGNRWEVVDDEGHQMRFNAKTNSATINYLIMPQIYLFTEAELSFRVKNVYYPVSSPEYVQGFVVVTDGETEREFPLMNAISFTKQTIDLAEFTGKTVTIKFYSPDKLTHTAWIELDDVAVKAVETWIFTNNTGDGLWTTKGNWDKGIKEDRIPTITDDVSIRKPATVDDEHATAKSIIIDHSNGNTGKITIQALKGLEVAGTIQLNTGSSLTSTTPADLILESSEGGNASLIFNNSNADQARVSLYSKASIIDGVKNYQYIGVPVTEANALYNYYGSWIYSWSDKGSGYGWKKVPNGGIVNAWTGYCITQEAPTTYAIKGTLVPTTSQDIAVPASENMVVGNSWTAPIDINAFEDDDFENLMENVYFFNTGVDKTGEGATTENASGKAR